MVGARSAAMAFNRLVDAEIDRAQSAHEDPPHPRGPAVASIRWGFTIAVSAAAVLLAAWELNSLCFRLRPVALAIVFAYSFTKRFTHLSHMVLGFALGIAPAAAWIAVRGSLDPRILLADRRRDVLDRRVRHHLFLPGLRVRLRSASSISVPSVVRHPQGAADRARTLHVLMIVCSWHAGLAACILGCLSIAGIAAVACPADLRARLVKADDLSRVNAAFFTMNGWVSVLFFVFWAADILLIIHAPDALGLDCI